MHALFKSFLLVAAIASQPAFALAGLSDAPAPSLTIYNQDFGVVRSHIPLKLTSGVNDISISDISAHVEPHSVILRDPTGKTSLQILEQNYRADPISQALLLSHYEGETIDFDERFALHVVGHAHLLLVILLTKTRNRIEVRNVSAADDLA